MSTSTDAPETPGRSSQLNGWKDIAAYLGRSVRTVQRWEKDFGLPVRRFGVSKPESVFALLNEIDAWLLTSQGVNARSGNGADADSPARTDARPSERVAPADRAREPLFPRGWFLRMGLVGAVEVVVLLSLWALWTSRLPAGRTDPPQGLSSSGAAPGGEPAAWQVDFDSLVVSDAEGNPLWRHAFPFPLRSSRYTRPPLLGGVLAGVEDIDGDGRREVWFVSYPERGSDWSNHRLFLFNNDGNLRWTYQFAGEVRFGADTFGPPWPVQTVFLTDDPDGTDRRALWVASVDRMMFPTVLQRLDLTTGEPRSTYWSNGYVLAVALARIDGRATLFVGAANNERKAGSLALMDAGNPNGSAPAEKDAYRCASCPPGEPETFLVFPKPKRFGKPDDTAPVFRIEPGGAGGLYVNVLHAVSGTGLSATAVYTLDTSFQPISVIAADGYAAALRAMASEGSLPPGGLKPVDPEREFLPIVRWDSAARRYVKVFLKR